MMACLPASTRKPEMWNGNIKLITPGLHQSVFIIPMEAAKSSTAAVREKCIFWMEKRGRYAISFSSVTVQSRHPLQYTTIMQLSERGTVKSAE